MPRPRPPRSRRRQWFPNYWGLIPSGLGPGDEFRLLFVSSTKRNAVPAGIVTYNTWIQNLAANGHADIQANSSTFRVVGSTRPVDARDNTETTGTGVPIYWLNGDQVADNYADFYDGSWDQESVDEDGVGVHGRRRSRHRSVDWQRSRWHRRDRRGLL